jgi:hypothetical protein
MRHWILVGFVLLSAPLAHAGLFELSATYNYDRTSYSPTNSTAKQSVTAGLGYFFWEMSALELSYTQGEGNQITPDYNAYQVFKAYGTGLLITLAARESAFKPYIKLGGVYLVKDATIYIPNFPSTSAHQEGLAPQAGLGFKLLFNQRLALKVGMTGQTSPLNQENTTYDLEGVVGLSFIF